MKNRKSLIGLVILLAFAVAQSAVVSAKRANAKAAGTKFTVRIENISNADGYTASNGAKWPFALSPGFYVVDAEGVTIFTEGKRAMNNGLEMQAEDGNPAGLISSLESYHHAAKRYGVFNMPVGATGPGPIGPGGAYEFTVVATPKMKLMMAMMFGQSNDLFYAPEHPIALFDNNGTPLSGDITSKFFLYDAGTEQNQELGIGADQAPRQKMHNTGAAENGVVHKATEEVFYNKTAELFRVTITTDGGGK